MRNILILCINDREGSFAQYVMRVSRAVGLSSSLSLYPIHCIRTRDSTRDTDRFLLTIVSVIRVSTMTRNVTIDRGRSVIALTRRFIEQFPKVPFRRQQNSTNESCFLSRLQNPRGIGGHPETCW